MRVRANQSIVVRVDGHHVAIKEGDAYEVDSPVVRDFPWAFGEDDGIEDATARPGERRNVRTKP